MSNNIVQFNEEIIKGQIKELVRGSVEEALIEMHLGTMASHFSEQLTDSQFQSLSFEEQFSILVDAEWSSRKSNRFAKLIGRIFRTGIQY